MIEDILKTILGFYLMFVIPTSIILFGIFFVYEVFIRFRK
jgi:hypothetical protein